MRISLRINYRKVLINVLMLLTVIGCFGYIRSIYIYHTTVKYMGFVLIYAIFILYCCRKYSEKLPARWRLVWSYIIITTPFLNYPNSSRYLIVLSLGMILLKLYALPNDFYERLNRIFIWGGAFFSFATLLQALVPGLFHIILRVVQSDKLYEQTLKYLERYGAYCGLAGESSFNAFCIALGMLCLVAQILARRKVKGSEILFILLMYYSILLTGKRSFLLMIPMIILCFFLFFAIAEKKRKYILLCTLLLIMMPIVFYAFLGEVIMKILASGKGSSTSSFIDLSNRRLFWNIALSMVRSKPLFGHGMMAFDNFYNSYFNNNYTFAGAHNSYLQLLGEMGVIGGGIYIIAILTTFIKGIKDVLRIVKNNKNGLRMLAYSSVCIQAMCIIYGFSGNPFHRPQQLLTYFIAVAMGMYVHKRNWEEV